MAEFVKIAGTLLLSPGQGRTMDVGGKSVALFNVDGTFYAIDDACTHVGGPLGDGSLDGETVTCPLHGARFNVKTGGVLGPPAGSNVKSYPVKVEGDTVMVELE